MAGTGNQLASLISALSALRLVMVRCLNASNVAFQRSDHIGRILKVNSSIREDIELL